MTVATKNFTEDKKFMRTVSRVLKEYSSPEQFEKDYNCKLLTAMGGISGVIFNNKSAMTAFYLKYIK